MRGITCLLCFILILHLSFISQIIKAQTPDNSTKASASGVTNPASVMYPNNVPVNFVRTWVPQKPYATDAEVVSKTRTVAEVNHVTAYADGLGRALQTIAWQASPVTASSFTSRNDMLSFHVYDVYGRETYSYLPFTSSASPASGFLNINPVNSQTGFYSGFTDQPNEKNEITYGKIIYDNTPLNKVTKTFAPGNSWAGTEGSTTAEHATKIDYQYNTSSDNVRVWAIANNALTYSNNDVTTNIPSTSIIYPDNQLSKTIVTDEHGKQTVEYKDSEGKLILKKVQIAATPSADYTGWLCTFYVYDDFGRLRFVIPPKAVTSLSNTSTFNWNLSYNNTNLINELCFRYEYDSKNRLIAKKSPGTGWVYIVYDKRDRQVYTQDANLRDKNQWMGTWYDDLDRPVQTGMLTGYTGNRDALQTAVLANATTSRTVTGNSMPANPNDLVVNAWSERRASYQAGNSVVWQPGFTCEPNTSETVTAEIITPSSAVFSTTQVFNNNIIPAGAGISFIPLTLTYYDDYSWTAKDYTATNNSKLDGIGSNPYGDPLPSQKSIKTTGLVTGSRVKVIEDPNDLTKGAWLESVGFYDDKDRLVQVQSENYKGGTDIITSRYNFTGNVLNTYEVYNNAAGNVTNLSIRTLMEYDHAGRLTKVFKKINDDLNKERLIAQYAYDAMGNLLSKKLGNKTYGGIPDKTSALENDTYSYNIRGWLKAINWGNYGGTTGPTTAQTSTTLDKWFAMDVSYDWGFSANQFNGSIAGQRWKTGGDGEERSYGYGYDAANRFTNADFRQKFGTSWATTDPTPPAGGTFQIDFSVAGIGYDENGNLKNMKQYGLQSNTSPLLDDLTYTTVDAYTNKLKTVTDGVTATGGSFGDFVHKSTASVDYGYDKNGNLITDLNKGFAGSTGIDLATGGGVLYNYLDQPLKITAKDDNNNIKTITYIYDAAGNKLEKRSTAADGNITVTTYIGGFVYQNNVLQYFSHEEGRVRVQRDLTTGALKDYVFDYFITDHLGNVRMILTDEVPDRQLYLASMEDASRNFETALFGDKIGSTAVTKPGGFDGVSANVKVSGVNGTTAAGRVGPGVVLKVMSGDKFKGSAYAWYQPTGMDNTVDNTLGDVVLNLLSQLTPQVAYLGKGAAGGGATNSILQPGLKTFSGTQTPQGSAPRAYLNYVVLDEKSFKAVQSGFIAVPQITGTTQKQLLQLAAGSDINITHNGYLYVWVSNESKGNVYFDDIRIDYQQGPLLEENHFYPYGLKMAALSSKAFGSLLNKFQYQGSYSEYDDETGYDEFALRNYDPQRGQWTGVDPYDEFPSPYTGMGNDPINNTDPSGGGIGDILPYVNDLGSDFLNAAGNTLITTAAGAGIGYLVGGKKGAEWGAGIGFAVGAGSYVPWGDVGNWFGKLFQNSDWLPLTKEILERYIDAHSNSNMEKQNYYGNVFERTFNEFARKNFGNSPPGENYQPNTTKICDDNDENCTIPDATSTLFLINNQGEIERTVPKNVWWEVTKTTNISRFSKKGIQLNKMASTLSSNYPLKLPLGMLAGAPRLNVVTPFDGHVGGLVGKFTSTSMSHFVSGYKMINGRMQVQFGLKLNGKFVLDPLSAPGLTGVSRINQSVPLQTF